MRTLVCAWAVVVMAAAVWTGLHPGAWFFTRMTGILPPHYGYSAYTICALFFLSPWPWARWAAGTALLLSGNRAAWVGAIAGWAYQGGRRRMALAAILGVLAVVGGYAWKPRTDNDSVRIQIWRAALKTAVKHPAGVGQGGFYIGVDGYAVSKAHSDVLQLLVEHGASVTAYVLAVLVVGLGLLPAGPAKALVIALSVQSIIDNRLHHPACAALYVAAWVMAARSGRLIRPTGA